jgi:hypothetical protein
LLVPGSPKARRRGFYWDSRFSQRIFRDGVQVTSSSSSRASWIYSQWLAVLTTHSGRHIPGRFIACAKRKKLLSFRGLALVECATPTLAVSIAFFVIRSIETGLDFPGGGALSASSALCARPPGRIDVPMTTNLSADAAGTRTRACRAPAWITAGPHGAHSGLQRTASSHSTCGIGLTLLLLWVIKVMNGWIVLSAEQ